MNLLMTRCAEVDVPEYPEDFVDRLIKLEKAVRHYIECHGHSTKPFKVWADDFDAILDGREPTEIVNDFREDPPLT